MKSYKNLYPKLCSYENLKKAFEKARKNKSSMPYVIEFEKDLENNLRNLKKDLESFTYKPAPLKRFIIKDPKTRVIRKSIFRDRVVHHAVVNILDPIYEKVFINDSYANRINKGTLAALVRFDKFNKKVSKNGSLVNLARDNNMTKGYVLKADIKHFFDSVNHEIMIKMFRRKIKDEKVIWLIKLILKNFDDDKKGMPLGNLTSQFFANVYLNDLDYFVKNKLRMKYYFRYVDDFVILHEDKKELIICKEKITKYLTNIKLELHPDKSKIFPLYKGVDLLGFRVYYYYKRIRKRNLKSFKHKLISLEQEYKDGSIELKEFLDKIEGWFAYARWANTYKLRKNITIRIGEAIKEKYDFIDDKSNE